MERSINSDSDSRPKENVKPGNKTNVVEDEWPTGFSEVEFLTKL